MKVKLYKSDNRHATWLELFFDLIFVVVLGKITHLLAHSHHGHLSVDVWIKFFLLFIPAWWIWVGHTSFANRFDDDSRRQRFFTLLLMFVLILLSITLNYDIEESYRWFIILYGVARLFIAGFFYSVRNHDNISKNCVVTFGRIYIIGAFMSSSAALFDLPIAIYVFYLGLLFDMIAPFFSNIKLKTHPIDREHFVERIGLLGLILLGESVIAISGSISDIDWTTNTIIIGLSGFTLLCMIWWIYFDSFYFLIESKLDINGNAILYSQLLTYMAFAILANMIKHAILLDISVQDFRTMVMVGMTLLYVGKQTSYWFNVPVYRKYNIRNTIVVMSVISLSLLFNSQVNIMLGVCCSMIVYIAVNYQSQIKLYGKVRM